MPSNTTFRVFFYTYVLESLTDGNCYIGYTEKDAKRREKYLKTTQGRRFLGLRLLEYKRQRAFGTES
ncbi:MAG: hypothetical protein A3B10_03295 [Candidatus Doudnabacteria bacterium RIFCSPLOWO2_01_FULL_44_21]|uniref:GIY-YIG domain-containing protein n=1 Tax=Candidatus Doudnabacteria bacterium RIFCSPLOWO2_01_FULL_44_21 TaxID=1817841 RepID=A0A1F5PYK2_9BACT|nr:MAG: hypothetical protein A3B95_02555 [Candidatus Doudnabacteria bacterium RIFCSPHIGHO2_02_FULL_43_13b]OGE94792.1 MAG: hypothetical protein A3B10_03295 [Candidatus Doudnabacteria bacterium RIFCSPLOWO2_01_FULL_44_21]